MWIGLVEQVRVRPLPPEQQLAHLPSLDEIADQKEWLAKIRAEALEAGVELPPKRFLPDVQGQVQTLNTTEAWQAYITAYMPLTHQQHVAHGSFADAVDVRLEDGRFIHRETVREEPLYAERLLASSLFASTLVIVSTWLSLGITEEADRLRQELVTAREPGEDPNVSAR
jgi:hypothetical protein